MKRFKKIWMLLFAVMFLGGFSAWLGADTARAAETQITPGSTMETAPQIELGNNYYSVLNNSAGYVKFTTPADGGYVTVYYKNISVDGWYNGDAYVKTLIGEELAHFDLGVGSDKSIEFLSEPDKRNDAQLEPNTTYYIEVGDEEQKGNVLYSVSFVKDDNPNGKDQSEKIAVNTSYTRTIDSRDKTDVDYFRFTTGKEGAHRFSINKSVAGNWDVYYYIRKWSTDELVKDSEGEDVNDCFYQEASRDIVLEANTEYYIKISASGIKSYTFSINNQSVTSISMASSKNIGGRREFSVEPGGKTGCRLQ